MKNRFLFALILAGAVSFTSCKSLNNQTSAHSSQNSLDWQGIYTGVLPCADCEGIKTVIRLDSNNNYSLETSYLGKSDKPDTQKGTFSWDKTGSKIILNNLNKTAYPTYYTVGENKLIQLDLKGNPITSELASKYILQKEPSQIVEKYWKLIEINGKPVAPVAEGQREAHLVLKAFDGRITGNGGCNGFGGNYELSPGNRIHIFKIMSTMMACPNLANENEFFKVLEKADNYSFYNDTLSLNKARMAPLAKFVAVYF